MIQRGERGIGERRTLVGTPGFSPIASLLSPLLAACIEKA
jgi:hypothetical protein